MKWIGQHIYDLVSRFRNDVYLEDISTGTIASGAHLGLDSNNKIVKAVDGGGDLTSIVAGTGLNGDDLSGPIPTLEVEASLGHVTTLAGLTSFGAPGATTGVAAGDLTMYNSVNDGNPTISLGSSAMNRFEIKTAYNSGAQTLDEVYFNTYTTSGTTNDGRYIWQVDEVELCRFLDSGISVTGNVSLSNADAQLTASDTAASSATQGGALRLQANDGAAMGDDHRLGVIEFLGAEDASSNFTIGARIEALCDAAWSASENGARLDFYTTDANASESLVLTLDSDKLATFAGAVTVTGALTGTLATASQTNIEGVGAIGTGSWRADPIQTPYIADDAITEDKLANTLLAEIDANTAKVTNVATNLTATTHASQITINSSDGDNVIVAEASGSIAGVMSVTHHDKLDAIEASATADQSKSDIDGLAITTVGTIDTGVWNGTAIATDQQKHLATFDIRGYSTADGTNYEIPVFVTDNNAPFEHNTSAGSDGLTALTVTKLIKATGVVMPYAGTLKKWKGWSTHSTTSGTCNIALFRYRPNASSASAVSLVLLDAVSHTPAANNTVIAIDETAFTDADVAAGDIIISGIKGDGGQVTYFVSTLEIEWD